jgi:hypothetical protein
MEVVAAACEGAYEIGDVDLSAPHLIGGTYLKDLKMQAMTILG